MLAFHFNALGDRLLQFRFLQVVVLPDLARRLHSEQVGFQLLVLRFGEARSNGVPLDHGLVLLLWPLDRLLAVQNQVGVA